MPAAEAAPVARDDEVDLSGPAVSLSRASLSPPLLQQLCAALRNVDRITALDVSHNGFGDAGAEVLAAELFSQRPHIVDIDLRGNGIGDLGVALVCRALSRHATCRSLLLGGNPVTNAGLADVGRLAAASKALTTLDLMDTPISLQGTLAFADALVRNESLLRVRLPHVLGHRVLREVDRVMRRNAMRRDRLDERRAAWDDQRAAIDTHRQWLEHQWRSVQPLARPPPPASGFTLGEWSDPVLAPTLVYLEVLQRRTQLAADERRLRAEENRRERLDCSRTRNHNAAPAPLRLPPIASR